MVRTAEGQLLALAERQLGLVSRAQLREIGVDRRRLWRWVRSGRWELALPGVWRVAGTPSTANQELLSACLWGGPEAVASHRSAARLWGLDGEWGLVPEVTVPYARANERVEGPVVHRTRRLDRRDRTVLGVIPVTRVERTVVDLAAVVTTNELEVALESSVRLGKTSPERLWRRAEALVGRPRLREVLRLLEARQPDAAHSRWEVKLQQLVRDAGLPEPVRQWRAWDGETYRFIDLAYPDFKLAIEYDSYRWHSGRQGWERTHTRSAGLVAQGWRVLPVTMDDVAVTPDRTVARIRRMLEGLL